MAVVIKKLKDGFWVLSAVVIGAPEQVGHVTQAVTEHAGYDELF